MSCNVISTASNIHCHACVKHSEIYRPLHCFLCYELGATPAIVGLSTIECRKCRIPACMHKPTSTHSPRDTFHQRHCSPPGHSGADVGQHPSTLPAPSSARTHTAKQEVRSCCTAVGQSHYGPGLEVHPLGDPGNAAIWLLCSALASAG